jgi:hypothetical protein
MSQATQSRVRMDQQSKKQKNQPRVLAPLGFLPHCPTMSMFLTSISPSFWRYERDIKSIEGIYTFDKLAALPFEKYLGIAHFEDAVTLYNAVQAKKNGNPCPYGDNSGRMLPVGYTPSEDQLSHEWDWSEPKDEKADAALACATDPLLTP